jgi:predicted nucleic acid-binding protein
LPYVETVRVCSKSPKDLSRCRDAEDQKFLLLTAEGKAEVLVSGDRALMELSGRTTFEIESPAQFKKRFF